MIETDNNAYRAQLITPYAYEMPFDFWSANDIQVWVTKNGVDTQLDPTEFTVFRNQVKLKSATYAEYSDYDSITFLRVVDPTQTTDYTNGTNINAEVIERSLDKLTAITQQLSEALGRTIKVSVSEDGSDITLPSVEGRANSMLGFGSDGESAIVRSLEQFDSDVDSAAENAAVASEAKGKALEAKDVVEELADESEKNALKAEGFANGQQSGVDVDPTSPYHHNNSKYWKEQAELVVADKADKAVPLETNNMAMLDSEGNLADSGISKSSIQLMEREIAFLRARGKFLSFWSCASGAPVSFPWYVPCIYQSGDYYIVSSVDPSQNQINYRPSGVSYDTGDVSTVVETDSVMVGDTYYYDGAVWLLLSGANIASFKSLVGAPRDNAALKSELETMDSAITSLMTTQIFESTRFNIEVASSASVTIDVTKSGYTPIGVVGIWVNGSAYTVVEWYVSGNTFRATVSNRVTSAVSNGYIRAYILYVKNVQ